MFISPLVLWEEIFSKAILKQVYAIIKKKIFWYQYLKMRQVKCFTSHFPFPWEEDPFVPFFVLQWKEAALCFLSLSLKAVTGSPSGSHTGSRVGFSLTISLTPEWFSWGKVWVIQWQHPYFHIFTLQCCQRAGEVSPWPGGSDALPNPWMCCTHGQGLFPQRTEPGSCPKGTNNSPQTIQSMYSPL